MVLSLSKTFKSKISRPLIITKPKRMYINIPDTTVDTIKRNIPEELSDIQIDGKSIKGFEKVVFVQQVGDFVKLCLGGDA